MAGAQTLQPTDGRESGPACALPSATKPPQRPIGAEVRARPEQRRADPRCEVQQHAHGHWKRSQTLSLREKRAVSGSLPDDASRSGLEDGNAVLRAGVLRLHVIQVGAVVLRLVVVLGQAAHV